MASRGNFCLFLGAWRLPLDIQKHGFRSIHLLKIKLSRCFLPRHLLEGPLQRFGAAGAVFGELFASPLEALWPLWWGIRSAKFVLFALPEVLQRFFPVGWPPTSLFGQIWTRLLVVQSGIFNVFGLCGPACLESSCRFKQLLYDASTIPPHPLMHRVQCEADIVSSNRYSSTANGLCTPGQVLFHQGDTPVMF